MTNLTADQRALLSARDIQALGIPRALAYQLLNRSDLPTVRLGRRVFIFREPFFRWLAEQAGEAVSVGE